MSFSHLSDISLKLKKFFINSKKLLKVMLFMNEPNNRHKNLRFSSIKILKINYLNIKLFIN
jgi:hypothetical protein